MKTRLPQLYWVLVFALFTCLAPRAFSADTLAITNTTWSPGGFQLQWTNLGPGTSYTIQSQDSLGQGIWLLPMASAPWPINLNQWTDASAVSNQYRFYRVLGVPTAERGKILGTSLRASYATSTIAVILGLAGVTGVTPQYPVSVYKINYETISPIGARTRASGALVLPTGASGGLPLLSYQHGTIARTNDAPSLNSSGEVILGVAFASLGYAAVLPDYLGLGESEGVQLYVHARSEATASVDMLRAARCYCASNSVTLNNKLFLCGYSQGGHATMALLRELETFHASEFTVTACAPMAGPYDMSGATTEDALSGRVVPNPYYYALLLASYQDVYHLAPTLADLLASPYNTTLPSLLHGNSTDDTLNAAMPNPPLQVLKPEYLANFRTNAANPLRLALRDNDLYRWTPISPMRMYHCGGDQDVPIINSQVAHSNFLARGASQVQFIIPSATADHGGCVEPSLTAAKAWFDSLK